MSLTPELPDGQAAAGALPVTPAGWYPDYTGEPQLRWWDGGQWTQHIQGGTAEPYSLTPQRATVAEGTPVFTPFIWILALFPLIGLIELAATDKTALFKQAASQSSIGVHSSENPLSLLLTLALYAATVLLAYFDRRSLLARGFDRPFHWAFAFIPVSGLVYVIGRSVVVRRRAGRGISPMWVSISLMALTFIFSLAFTISLFSQMVNSPGFGSNA